MRYQLKYCVRSKGCKFLSRKGNLFTLAQNLKKSNHVVFS